MRPAGAKTNVSTPWCRQLALTSIRLNGSAARVHSPSPGSCQVRPTPKTNSQYGCDPAIGCPLPRNQCVAVLDEIDLHDGRQAAHRSRRRIRRAVRVTQARETRRAADHRAGPADRGIDRSIASTPRRPRAQRHPCARDWMAWDRPGVLRPAVQCARLRSARHARQSTPACPARTAAMERAPSLASVNRTRCLRLRAAGAAAPAAPRSGASVRSTCHTGAGAPAARSPSSTPAHSRGSARIARPSRAPQCCSSRCACPRTSATTSS